jgi:ACR3 family arsenite efflux pump ArsB
MALATSYFGSEASLFIAVAGHLVQLPGMLVFVKMASGFKPLHHRNERLINSVNQG